MNSFEEPPRDDQQKRIDEAIVTLAEHFDTVHVFGTILQDDGETSFYDCGRGNWFARWGHVSLWVDKQRESDRERARITVRNDQ